MVLSKDSKDKTAYCHVCGSNDCQSSIKYNKVSVMQNFVETTEEQAKKSASAEIDLYLCLNCGFVFNIEYNENNLKYIQGYDNNRNNSAVYREYLDEVEDFIVDNLELQNKRFLRSVVEMGAF
jgi:hypothetical protein